MPRVFTGKIVLYLLFLLTLDGSLLPILGFMFKPALLYLMVLYTAFEWSWEKSFPMAIMVGVLRDIAGSAPLGVETCTLIFAAFFLDFVLLKVDRQAVAVRMTITFLFVFLVSIIIYFLSALLVEQNRISWWMILNSLAVSLVTAAAAPLFFRWTGRLFGDRVPLRQYELFG